MLRRLYIFYYQRMEEAKELAEEIDELNKLRKDIVKQITEEAIAEVENNFPPEDNKVLVLAKEALESRCNWNCSF